MALTARIPDALKNEAELYASHLGISLNALLVVALRDYLDARKTVRPHPGPLVPATAPPAISKRQPRDAVDEAEAIPREVARASCWCGSGKQLRYCHRRLRLRTD